MDYDDYYGFKPYVSVGARRAQAARELAKLQKKGRKMSPVVIEGRTIARTFWGEAWCDNLERYSDFANRLPRGRTYVRNGSVVDLQVGPGSVDGARQRLDDVRREGDGRTGAASPLERHLQGLLGRHRLARRAPAGTLLEGRDDASLRGEDGAVPVTEGHPLHVQLSGLGVDVQARGGGAVRHRRATGSSAGVALHAPQGRSAGLDCEGRLRSLEEAQGTSRREGARERRSLGDVRHRDGAGGTAEARRSQHARDEAIDRGALGNIVQADEGDQAGETERAGAQAARWETTADTGEATSDIGAHAQRTGPPRRAC